VSRRGSIQSTQKPVSGSVIATPCVMVASPQRTTEGNVRVRLDVLTSDVPYRLGRALGHALVFASSGASAIAGVATGALCFAMLDLPEAEYVRLVYQLRSAALLAWRPDQLVWHVIGWSAGAMHHSEGRSIEAVVALSVSIQAAILGMTIVQFVFLSAFWTCCILDRVLLITLYLRAKGFVKKAIEQRRRLRNLRQRKEYDSSSDSE
jgi:hypothetical protein